MSQRLSDERVEFFGASKILIVAGKGGVGKTTVGATLGLAAARAGRDVLLVELEGRSNLASAFDRGPLGYEEQELLTLASGRVRARRITPDEALADYLGNHGLDRVSGRLTRSGAIDVVSTAAPGIRDLLALGRIRSMEENNDADLIVVDAPAAGHAISFLRSPAGLLDSAAGGPVRSQAETVLAMMADESRCQVMLVTTPEETPVTEVIETAYALEEDIGVKLAPIIMNSVWPRVEGLSAAAARAKPGMRRDAAEFRLAHHQHQEDQIERLAAELPLPTHQLPFLFSHQIGLPELTSLAEALEASIDGGGGS